MFEFSIDHYGSCADWLAKVPNQIQLTFGSPIAGSPTANGLQLADVFGDQSIHDSNMADCCRSGLLFAYDQYDASHEISQDIETTTGSYWHAILHRREPDFPNAKYWFRRVGTHPVYDSLNSEVQRRIRTKSLDASHPQSSFLATQSAWDAADFVDLCETAITSDDSPGQLCRDITMLEFQLLFDYSYHAALA